MNLLAIFVAAASLAGPKHVAPSMQPLPINGYIPVVQTSPPTPGLEFPPLGKPAPEPQIVGTRVQFVIQVGSKIAVSNYVNYAMTVEVLGDDGKYKDARGMYALTYGAKKINASAVDINAIRIAWGDTSCDASAMARGVKMTLLLDKGHKFRFQGKYRMTADEGGDPRPDSVSKYLYITTAL